MTDGKERLVAEQLRLMAVHAHPDDESSKGAATMAKYVDQGVDVLVVTCTGGERGSVLNPRLDCRETQQNIAVIRRQEMERARQILGVRQSWLGFVDSGLPAGSPEPPLPDDCFARQDVERAAERLVRMIRDFRAHIVITYDEDGGYPHPDHIMTHKISVVAFDAAGDPERYLAAGDPWQPLKLYCHAWPPPRLVALHEAMLASGQPSPFAGEPATPEVLPCRERRVTTRVECGEYFARRDAALRAHATQIAPDSPWFLTPLAVERQQWPTEDYELIRSFVDSAAPEDDLFAGVRETVGA